MVAFEDIASGCEMLIDYNYNSNLYLNAYQMNIKYTYYSLICSFILLSNNNFFNVKHNHPVFCILS